MEARQNADTTSADIACGGNIVIGIAIKKFGYFYPAAIAILYLPWFIARKDYWIHVGGRE
ncbi:hypothetical protein ACLK19_27405 [Escherichia coli]